MYAPAQTKAFKGTCGTYHQVTLNGQILGYVRSWEKGRFGIEQTLLDQPSNFWHGGFKSKALAAEAVCKQALLVLKTLAAAKSQASAVFRMLMTSVQDILNQCKSADRVGTVTGGCYSATWSGGQLHCLLLLVPKHANVYGIGTDSVEAVEDLVVCKWSVNDFPLCHVWVDSIRTIPEGATDNVVVDLVRELDHRGEDISTYLSRSRGVFGCFRSTTTKGN